MPEIIESKEVCIVGIGTLINDKNVNFLRNFPKKIVFSSGVGYGGLTRTFDDSWDFSCVRGPNSAEQLRLKKERGICDGAVLLSDFYPVIPKQQRNEGIVFIPHLKTDWSAGIPLSKMAKRAGASYLPPNVPLDEFIAAVSGADLVITEAMHGAILADTMRVPWIPVNVHEHNRFKWEDWFSSLELKYQSHSLSPLIWNPTKHGYYRYLKIPYQLIKEELFLRSLKQVIAYSEPILSSDKILSAKKEKLYECVRYINEKYG
ncbi:polysaccharide pyruvyl transferase family protein [Marinobacter salinus]|uniref:polysaccharide pyruvyl transferase family protein n=1 Tax=Marinobacter salinus TaxID=1874317 RepID=UPI0012FD2EE9|nr:polysaccharide pyruvyl transferase family protein [Marinobacter salinus]